MSLIIRPCNCHFRNSIRMPSSQPRTRPGVAPRARGLASLQSVDSDVATVPASLLDSRVPEGGYALLLMMMAVTLLLVSLTVVLPSVYMEAQRDREEELIFRGNEYARAIALFHSRFARYPNSVDDLLKKTNGVRFLRRAYKDPMAKSGAWRFIHVNAAGMLVDSKTMNVQNAAAFGSSNSSLGTKTGSSTSGTAGGMGGTATAGASSSSDDAVSGPAAVAAATDQGQAAGQGQAPSGEGGTAPQSGQATPQSPGFSTGNQAQGSFIAGVASMNKKRSIRIWNDKKHYDEWEFLGVALTSGITPQLPTPPRGIGPNTGSGPQPTNGPNQGNSQSQPGQAPGPVQLVPPPQGEPVEPTQPEAPADVLNPPQ
jgi:type II secretory pathway pseudopilin PulG